MKSDRRKALNWLTRPLALLLLTLALPAVRAGQPFTTFSAGDAEVVVSHAGEDYVRFGLAAWGPGWSWVGFQATNLVQYGSAVSHVATTIGKVSMRLFFRAERIAPNKLRLQYDLSAEKDLDLTLFVAELLPGRAFHGQELNVESAGKSTTVPVPFGKRVIGQEVSRMQLTDPRGAKTILRFDPPCEIAADDAARIVLAQDRFKAGAPRKQVVEVELPGPTDWFAGAAEVPQEPGIDAWYPWSAAGVLTNSLLSLADWLEKPAGKYGRILRQGEHLMYHGQPIRLWGLNLCYGACSPEKTLADKRAAFYAKYGINSVRLHKFADGSGWSGIQAKDSAAEYDAAGLDRMDYQVAKFKEAGIYVKLSAHFGTIKMGPADIRDVPYVEEFGKLDAAHDRVSAPHSAFFYSPELQNLHIRQIVNLLRHTNAYTGLTYAADPAVSAVEIINEQSIMFFTSMAPLKQSATLRRKVGERFSDWLKKRYGSQEGLLKAWGPKGLDGFEKDGFAAGESLEGRNILPLGNPWYWDPQQLNGSQNFRKRRLLDTLEFLYELQCEAYDRYVAAVRNAGYDGEILGSNWQAGRAFSHFANLHSDARVGLIDRHNYFGGAGRGKAKFNNNSMLARAGSGSLSSGLQQVDGLPFMLSEWIHVFPNEWGVEGPAIIGAYGLGLQGWDVSYLFQNGDNAAFSQRLGGSPWDVMAPQILGIFPAVARQVLRGDVMESTLVAPRNVHMKSLFEGRLGFDDTVVQGYDDKELDSGKVSARALAVARCPVKFTSQWEETPAFDLGPWQKEACLVASTGQLRWKEGQGKTSGWFAMDTDGTKAVVGFAKGETCRLGEVSIQPQSRFAAIYVTAPEKDGKISTSRRLLVTALARARNSGMKLGVGGDELLEPGKGPVLIEPVKATITVRGRRILAARPLDHDGCPTGKTVPVSDHEFMVDTSRDRTPYYELVVE
jgi:hypothetical protein